MNDAKALRLARAAARTADLFAAEPGKGADLSRFTLDGQAHARTAGSRLRETMSARDFGAVGLGVGKPVGDFFATLADAQVHYPLATALTDKLAYNPLCERFSSYEQAIAAYPWLADLYASTSDGWKYQEQDWAAFQHAIYQTRALNADTGVYQCRQFDATDGDFAISRTLLLPPGMNMAGRGRSQTKGARVTRFLQTSTCMDVFRFDVLVDPANGQGFWFGTLRDFHIYGYSGVGATERADSTGIALYTADGTPVALQNNSHFADITVRGIKGHGYDFARGGLPGALERLEAVFCTGYGLIWRSRADGVAITGFSADGNGAGGMLIDALGADSSLLIANPKFEAHYSYDFPASGGFQLNPIRIKDNGDGAQITILAPSSIRAITDPGYVSGDLLGKPGDLIVHEGSNTPSLRVIAPAIRVRTTDNPADPEPLLFSSAGLGIYVPRGLGEFTVSKRNEVFRSGSNDVHRVFGAADGPMTQALAFPSDQLAGASPGRFLRELDAPANAAAWLEMANAGALDERVYTSAGAITRHHRVLMNASDKPCHEFYRATMNLGTTLTSGDFTLGGGWGSGASLTIINASKDNRFEVQITAGSSGLAANPAVTLTFKDGVFASTPFPIASGYNSTDNTGIDIKASASASQVFLNMLGTPVAGKVYRLQCHVL
ncbi:hypothetical protein [Novosphingobium colocasiae]|uniref:hypothetical protein n=1 Tax=Novosphingobium colocasiae TaxID=1256513 RepID=UPI0035B01C59